MMISLRTSLKGRMDEQGHKACPAPIDVYITLSRLQQYVDLTIHYGAATDFYNITDFRHVLSPEKK